MKFSYLLAIALFYNSNLSASTNDAGILTVTSPKKSFCPSTQAVTVTLKNYGSNTLSSATIGWTLNGLAQSSYNWTGTLASSGTTSITLGIDSFKSGKDTIIAWTQNPNGVADSNLSNDTAKMFFTVNILPGPNAGANTVLCSQKLGISLGIASKAGHSYYWTSNPSGFTSTISNPTIYPTITRTYYLTETIDSTGCSASDSVRVTINPLPDAKTGGDHTICIGDTILLGAPAIAGHDYVWKTRAGAFISNNSEIKVSPLVSTTYFLTETIFTTGCQKNDSAHITVNSLSGGNIGNDQTICGSGTVKIGVSWKSGINYKWSSKPTGLSATTSYVSLSPSITRMYYLTQVDTKTGCTRTDSVLIKVFPKLIADAGGNRTICPGESVQIGKPAIKGISYSWTSSPTGFYSAQSNPVIKPTASTTYYLTETVDSSGCTASSSSLVTIDPLPTPYIGKNRSICSGDTITMSTPLVKGHSYSWRSNPLGTNSTSNGVSVKPSGTTTYFLTETNSTGCSITDSVTITVNPRPIAVAGHNETICAGASTTLGSAPLGGIAYNWTSDPAGFSSSSSNPTVLPESTTIYYLTETNGSGCSGTSSVTITVNPTPNSQFIITNKGKTYYFRAKDPYLQFYHWAFGDAATDTSSSYVSHTYKDNGKYLVSLFTGNIFGCDNSYDTTIEVKDNSGLDDINTLEQNVQVFPNPTSNDINIAYTLADASKTISSISDITGKELYRLEKIAPQGKQQYTLHLRDKGLLPGIYILRIQISNSIITKELVLSN